MRTEVLGESIGAELSSPALAKLAKEIASTIRDFESRKIDSDQAKVKITGFRTLVQIVAIDWMASNYKNQRRIPPPAPRN